MRHFYRDVRNLMCKALPVNLAISELTKLAPELAEFVAKAVILLDTTQNLNEWIFTEISNRVILANQIRVKTDSGKLSAQDYMDSLFTEFGEDLDDVKVLVNIMLLSSKFKRDYGEIELTERMISSIWLCEQELMEYLIPILTSATTTVTTKELETELYTIITKYGKQVEKNNAK